jgi:DNA-binding transcriptional MerR regulator
VGAFEESTVAWSTRELAGLAGTTLNTIRHYHRLGLLEVPEREDNGYKQYEIRHLVRLLRIRRLTDLGVPLAQIGAVAEGDDTAAALRRIDAELAADIARREQARADIAAILADHAPADVPPGFEPVASRLSEADSSMLHLYRRFYDDEAIADLRQMVDDDTDDVSAALDALPADADDATRQALAERLAPVLAKNMADYPWLTEPGTHLKKSPTAAQEMFIEAMMELYNPAQRNVLGRAAMLARGLLDAGDAGTESAL